MPPAISDYLVFAVALVSGLVLLIIAVRLSCRLTSDSVRERPPQKPIMRTTGILATVFVLMLASVAFAEVRARSVVWYSNATRFAPE